jgi:hypothetical protein
MGVFRRRYPDGQLSKDWYIDYRVNGKRYKRRIGPHKKLAEQVLMDIEVKKAKGEYLGIHELKKITLADFLDEYLTSEVYPIVKTMFGATDVWCEDLAVAGALLRQVSMRQTAHP